MGNEFGLQDGNLKVIYEQEKISIFFKNSHWKYILICNLPLCKKCSNVLETSEQKSSMNCGFCTRVYGLDRVYAMSTFVDDYNSANDDLSGHIYGLKKKKWWAEPLGYALAITIMKCYPELLDADAIIPIPIHESKLEERGFNQSLELSLKLSDGLKVYGHKISIEDNILQCDKYLELRNLHTIEERYEAVKGAFSVSNYVDFGRVLLVDDVFTSGATASECAKILKENGAEKVDILVAGRHKYDPNK